MKSKKSSDKSIKSEANKSVVLRNEQKVNKKVIQSSERVCNRCKVHQIIVSLKGHKSCPSATCDCVKCLSYLEKCRRSNENYKRRLLQKKNKDRSKVDNNSVVNSLKTKSKKILINKKIANKSLNCNTSSAGNSSKKQKSIGSGDKQTTGAQTQASDPPQRPDSPPRLRIQQPIGPVVVDSNSATDVEDNVPNTQPVPEKSSSLLCAQYLKKSEGLTRELKKLNLTDDELLACFKYSMIQNCLGDIQIATQNIIFANQAIRMGALYLIQNPDVDANGGHTSNISSAAQQTVQQSVNSAEQPVPMFCSTFNRNARPNNVPNYSPAFTPIRRQ